MSLRKELRDYEELLDFAREELRSDQQKLIRMRNLEADPDQLEELEKQIDLLNKAVDRYQSRIKTLRNAIHESENH